MKSVIHQTFCHVFDFDARGFPLAKIDDAFVGDEAAFAFEQNREMRVEPFGNVIRVQNCDLAGSFQSGSAPIIRMYIQVIVRMLALP